MRRRYMSDTNIAFDNSNYMTINALEDGVEIVYGTSCEYGVNGVGWYKYPKNSVIILNSGESVSFRNISNESESFNIKGQCGLSGNVMSLLFGDNAKSNKNLTGYPSAFSRLFQSCTGIRFVSSNFLPATTLAVYCYYGMFFGCTSLTTAPELPATTLASDCYQGMFAYCSSLVNAPELPATTLANYCYQGMFAYCTNLNYIKMFATNISARYCLDNWVSGVASSGTFVKNKNATWYVTGVNGVPSGWTIITE